MDSGEEIKCDISEAAIKAAINFTSTFLDHTCLISGRKIVADVLQIHISNSIFVACMYL